MIGIKSIAVAALAAGAFGLALANGVLDPERFAHLSAQSAFAIGLFASAAGALVGWSARPAVASRIALALHGGRPALVGEPAPERVRELPPVVQRGLLVGVFACLALATFSNEATARIAAVPDELAEPSRAEYCHEAPAPVVAAAPAPAPEPPPVDEAGCALVKRAFKLGYAKSLGSCAPKAAVAPKPAAPAAAAREVCTRRQLDEPFAHFAWRRLEETVAGASPVDAASARVDAFQTRVEFTRDLLADIGHAITGTPHASHHLWVNLPDPHPRSWHSWLTGEEPCTGLFEHLALWPRWTAATPASAVFEHVLGQLLFATRFGTPASCSDYTIHWNAPADACARISADPAAFLGDSDALPTIRGVLDRRARQVAIRRLADELGDAQTLPIPPPARAVVSIGCVVVDERAGRPAVSGRDITLDGESIAVREVKMPAIRATGAGPVDTYVALALLLGGKPYAGPAQTGSERVLREPPGSVDEAAFPLLALEPLVHADPFTGARAPLDRAELADVFPYEQHLFAFVDAFRRVYLPQRGRL